MIPDLLAGYLLNAAWQAPVVALCAIVAARFAGLTPAARHRLWLGFLGVAVLLPAASLGDVLPHAQPTVSWVTADTVGAMAPLTTPAAPGIEPALRLAPWLAWAMAGLCAIVALAMIARLSLAVLAARRLVRQARPAELPARVMAAVETLAKAHGRAAPRVLSSAAVSSPAVVGALRPAILTPRDWQCAEDDLRAALLHEMAHVLRHDYAVNLACEVLTLPVAWHPALIAIKTGVRKSRELACDAIAASAMASRKTYARCLVSLAQSLAAPAANPTQAALAVGLFGRSDLEDRLMQLMKPHGADNLLVGAARACGLTGLVAGLLGSAALLHVTPVFAQPVTPTQAVPAVRAVPPISAVAASPAQPAAAPRARHGLIYTRNGVTIESGDTGHRHTWTTEDGKTITVTNDEATEPSADQRKAFEADARDAEARAAEAEKLVNSPDFKARIAAAKASAAEAEKMVNSPEFKARIAKAKASAAEAEKMVNSPEFKARIAAANAGAAAAEQMVNSPEFKARIARAKADAARAEEMVNAPEFRARLERLRRDHDEPGPAERQTP